jgi:hypothetical protein
MYGDHDFRIGMNYSYRTVKFNNNGSANGIFAFPTDADFNPSDPATYPDVFNFRAFGPSTSVGVPGNEVLGLFIQDDWQVVPDLTLNLGLRYDWEGIVDDNNNLAPRLGFAWDVTGDGRTVIRGGYGRFYERLQVGTFNNFILDAPDVTQGFFIRTPNSGIDQQFFIDYAQANGITTLNGLRDALIADIEAINAGLSILNTNPTVDNASRRSPYADTLSIGAEREVFEGLSIGADVVRTQNRQILMAVDLNPNGGASPINGGGGTRPDISIYNGGLEPRFASITTYLNGGESDYTALQMSAKRRFGDSPIGRFAGTLAWTWANQSGNAEPISPDGSRFQLQTQTGYNFDAPGGETNGIPYGTIIGESPDLGISSADTQDISASWHRDHIVAASWTWEIPGTSWTDQGGIMFSGVYQYSAGDKTEFFAETFLDNGQRDLVPGGTYNCIDGGGANADICQGPKDFTGKENGATTDAIHRWDMSFRYVIPVQRTNVTVLFDIFNIFNTVNFGSSLGSTRAANGSFLIPNSALQPREFQIGARIDF